MPISRLDWMCVEPCELFLQPRQTALHKLPRRARRPAAGNRHARRAIRTEPQQIPPRPWMTDHLQRHLSRTHRQDFLRGWRERIASKNQLQHARS